MKTFIISFTGLFLIWLLLSGYFKSNLLILGVLSCLSVTWLALRLKIYSRRRLRLKFNLSMPLYLPWLLKEIIKSNLHVAAIIIHPGLPVNPQTLKIRPRQKTSAGIAIHANSITLTPGTISVDITDDDQLLVHALTDHTARGIRDGAINKQVRRLEARIQ